MDEPAASTGMSAMLPKAEVNSERSPFAIRYEQLIPLLIAEVQDLRNILISAGLIKSK